VSGAGGVIRGDIANLYQVRGGLLKMTRDPADRPAGRAAQIQALRHAGLGKQT
jgi:hypothetical protein